MLFSLMSATTTSSGYTYGELFNISKKIGTSRPIAASHVLILPVTPTKDGLA